MRAVDVNGESKRQGADRLHLLLGAVAILALLTMPIAFAGAAGGPEASSSASVTKQVKKLKGRIAKLEASVAALQGQAGAARPPTGAAGGDLTGTYPNPIIGPNAVTGDDILDTSLSGFSELALDSVGTGQIGTDGVGSSELNEGTISSCASPVMINGFASVGAHPSFPSTFTFGGLTAVFNCSGGGVQVRRVSTGIYRVRFNAMSSFNAVGVADAGATGGGDDFVSINAVNDGGPAFEVIVSDHTGVPEDVSFTILAL